MKQHYICQTRHGGWMIGTLVKKPEELGGGTSVCGGSCVEEPFASVKWFDRDLARPITVSDVKPVDGKLVAVKRETFQCDGWSHIFRTQKSLVEALRKIGYDRGRKFGYHCWEIVKAA